MKGLAQLLTLIMFLVVMLTNTLSKTIDPYKVLGIGRDATQDDIRQGFKKRSKKYHPDVNKEDPRAKQKFAKIANAYQLLKDPQRKKIYDLTGSDDPNQHGDMRGGFGGFPGGFGMNIQDIINMGFGGGGFGQGGGFRQQQQQGGGRGGSRTYTFTFGAGGAPGGGFRFEM